MKLILTFFALFLFSHIAFSGMDWIQLDLCKSEKNSLTECKNVGKSLFMYNKYVKKTLELGKVEGVVYLEKGDNRGTNQKRAAEYSGYYYLVNDMGDINSLITKWSMDPEISVK